VFSALIRDSVQDGPSGFKSQSNKGSGNIVLGNSTIYAPGGRLFRISYLFLSPLAQNFQNLESKKQSSQATT
jgi:hypothetical protein